MQQRQETHLCGREFYIDEEGVRGLLASDKDVFTPKRK